MTLSLTDVEFLISPQAAPLLADLADQDLSNLHMLSILTRLRRTVSSEQAAASEMPQKMALVSASERLERLP